MEVELALTWTVATVTLQITINYYVNSAAQTPFSSDSVTLDTSSVPPLDLSGVDSQQEFRKRVYDHALALEARGTDIQNIHTALASLDGVRVQIGQVL